MRLMTHDSRLHSRDSRSNYPLDGERLDKPEGNERQADRHEQPWQTTLEPVDGEPTTAHGQHEPAEAGREGQGQVASALRGKVERQAEPEEPEGRTDDS